jgi:hypothetical protein
MMKQPALFISLGIASLTFALLCTYPSSASAQEPRPPAQGAPPIPESAYEPQGFLGEPGFITRAAIFADRHFGNGDLTNGFYVNSFNMIPGAGWIAAGPGYRQWLSQDRMFFDTSAAISWRGYKTAQAQFELPRLAKSRLALGSQVQWNDYTQVNFFGEGPAALESNQSEYRLKSTNLVGYATLRPAEWVDVGLQLGVLNPSVLPRSGTFKRDRPDTRDVFPGDIVFALPEQPGFVHSEASIAADTRDFAGHPTRGGLYRVAAANYSDRDAGLFSFKRYEAEAAHFIGVADSRVVFALHGWLVTSDTADGGSVPFYLQPSLGGHNSLRGYADYRFHDRNMLLVNTEARIAMMTHVDAALFWDAANVAARIGDLNLDKRSWGAGLRLHSRRQTYARFDAARGDEGWRFVFRLTDPLQLGRLTRRTAAAPFVP